MSNRLFRTLAWIAFFGGAFIAGVQASSAQVVPPPASDVPVPPAPLRDTTDTVPRDTIKAPIGRAPAPTPPAIGGRYVWEGDRILASGAFTVADLLNTVPEVTMFRTGWMHAAQYAAVAGDVSRIRLFLDDVEIDPIDPRGSGLHELSRYAVWPLQRVAIERVGAEIRIDMRSWTVNNTSPFTRTDVYTGTEETDLYRGYYGKRFNNGAILQVGAEQASTENTRFGGGGDAATLLGRLGIGRSFWSLDVFAERRRQTRSAQTGEIRDLLADDASHTFAYARAAIGRATRGPFLEFIASTQGIRGRDRAVEIIDTTETPDTVFVEGGVSRAQYVATAGYRSGALVVSLSNRIRRIDHASESAVSGRVEFLTRLLEVSARGESGGEVRTLDGTVRLQPFNVFSVLASGSRRTTDRPGDTTSSTSFRIEGGLNLTGIWLYGGRLTLDASAPALNPLDVVEELPEDTELTGGRRTASYVGMRGRGWKGFGAHTYVLRWDEPQMYMPEYQARMELNYETQALSRFPRGQFGFRVAVADEFRSGVDFLTQRVGASHVLWGLMEIRISRATMTLRVQNPLGKQYYLAPGFQMPRGLSTYGIRWYFWG